MPRKLRVEFRTDEAFRREYIDNISNGGIFIATRKSFDVREQVSVELVFAALDESAVLEGEVVHCIPPELAPTGASPGVAIQFLLDAEQLQKQLGQFAPGASASIDEQGFGAGRRGAPRSRVRVLVQVCVDGQWFDGRTRNVSSSGVLVSLGGEPLAVGRSVLVSLTHPLTQQELELDGVVRRHIDGAGETCLGIEFRIPETRRHEFAGFLAQLRTAEHNRHLGGISGPIADLGMERLVQMFGSTAPEGTLTLSRLEEEGVIAIDHGVLRAKLGEKSGRDALTMLLAWRDGYFEFEARIESTVVGDAIPVSELLPDPVEPREASAQAPQPLAPRAEVEPPATSELELIDIVGLEFAAAAGDLPGENLDAEAWADPAAISASKLAIDVAPIADDATLAVTELADAEPSDDLTKTEQALLDLAVVGVTVGKAVDIIPEPAADVYAALTGLIAMGVISIH